MTSRFGAGVGVPGYARKRTIRPLALPITGVKEMMCKDGIKILDEVQINGLLGGIGGDGPGGGGLPDDDPGGPGTPPPPPPQC